MTTTVEPLGGTAGLFPLARYPGADSAEPARPAARPFGTRYAVMPELARTCPAVDFSTWRYDPVRQIAVVHSPYDIKPPHGSPGPCPGQER